MVDTDDAVIRVRLVTDDRTDKGSAETEAAQQKEKPLSAAEKLKKRRERQQENADRRKNVSRKGFLGRTVEQLGNRGVANSGPLVGRAISRAGRVDRKGGPAERLGLKGIGTTLATGAVALGATAFLLERVVGLAGEAATTALKPVIGEQIAEAINTEVRKVEEQVASITSKLQVVLSAVGETTQRARARLLVGQSEADLNIPEIFSKTFQIQAAQLELKKKASREIARSAIRGLIEAGMKKVGG